MILEYWHKNLTALSTYTKPSTSTWNKTNMIQQIYMNYAYFVLQLLYQLFTVLQTQTINGYNKSDSLWLMHACVCVCVCVPSLKC